MTWDAATKMQNEALKKRMQAPQQKGASQLSRDLETLQRLAPQLDTRFKVGFTLTVITFVSAVGMLFGR